MDCSTVCLQFSPLSSLSCSISLHCSFALSFTLPSAAHHSVTEAIISSRCTIMPIGQWVTVHVLPNTQMCYRNVNSYLHHTMIPPPFHPFHHGHPHMSTSLHALSPLETRKGISTSRPTLSVCCLILSLPFLPATMNYLYVQNAMAVRLFYKAGTRSDTV